MLDLSRLPKLDSVTVAGVNLISSVSSDVILQEVGGTEASMKFEAANPGQTSPDDIKIRAKSGLGSFLLRFPVKLFDKLSDISLPQWEDEDRTDFFFKCRLMYILQFLLKTAELETYAWEFDTCDPSLVDDGPTQWFQVHIEEQRYECSVAIIKCIPSVIEQLVPPSSIKPLNISLRSELRLPTVCLSVEEVKCIEPGDAFILSGHFDQELPAMLALPNYGGWDCVIQEDGTINVLERFQENEMENIVSPFDEEALSHDQQVNSDEWLTDDTTDPLQEELEQDNEIASTSGSSDIEMETADLSGVPIQVDFCLASKTFSLAQLESLSPGNVLDFRIDLADPVSIMANGKALGSGRLIQIGDRVGVRVESWQAPQDAKNA